MSSSQGEVVEEMVIGVDIDDELHSDSGSSPTLGHMERSSNPLSRSTSSQDHVEVDHSNDADDYDRRRTDRDQERGEIRDRNGGASSGDVTGRFEISDGEGDEEYRRKGYSARVLFIHGLSRQATEAALKDRFAQYGTVTALHIPFNAVSRTPKIYGFVRMSTPEEATAALEGETGKTFMGQMIEVERAKRGEDAEDRGRGRNFNRSYSGARDGRPQRGGYYGGRPNNGGGYRREYSPQPPPARYSVRDDYPPSRPFVAGPPPHVDRYPVAHPPRRDYDRYEPAEVRRRDPYDMPPAPYRPRDPYGGYDYPPHGPAPPARHYPRDYPPAPVGPPAGRYNAPPPSSAPYYDSPQHAQHYNDYPPAHTGAYRSGPPPPGERPMPPRRRYDDRPEEDPAYPARFERRLGNNGAPNARPYPPPPPHGPSRGRSPPPPNARY